MWLLPALLEPASLASARMPTLRSRIKSLTATIGGIGIGGTGITANSGFARGVITASTAGGGNLAP